ncbi:TonB-dependent receptor plug domain-containing protein [Mucilaginibacter flavus]|uniref:TonB-dependent receptor plug domain-containing protein n=1 Tax=Mucilaginibacter flavus TaxID=931504 RepID=UPI0025B5494D|nr:TonB-dependent receptor plug domain-containing protein [Mucilaginibacter flavus]MDN3581081.1 TonB-dependent receptor [Mucilaginibacter flavus]
MKHKQLFAGLLTAIAAVAMLSFTGPGDDLLHKMVDQLYKWRGDHPQEKVYLQFDKPNYAIGDDIWFKAYVTIGSKHQLSALSEILNVDLIDENDSVKRSLKLPVSNGLAAGDFALADSMKEGSYHIRAYTNWMRNESEGYFFDKTFTVVNSINNTVFTKTAFTYSTQNGKQKVNALINYTNIDGEPYSVKEVNYRIELNNKNIAHGKGITDDKGSLNVSFINTTTDMAATGRVVTNIKLDKKVVEKSIILKAVSNKVDVQFFPESGNLVNGVYSKVAFKAVAADGLGADIKGTVVDDQNQQVATFNSTHLGMGVFKMIPLSGKTYKAHVTYADGSEGVYDLPKAIDNGYVLDVDNSYDDNIVVKIMAGKALLESAAPTSGLLLVGQSGGEIYYAGNSADGGKTFTSTIAKSKFPSGIIQFTLFNDKGEPLNERLVFIRAKDEMALTVSADKQKYAPREKVKISLNAKNPKGVPVVGSFSASVIDLSKVKIDETAEESILSNVLLTSDIKGYVEKPGYYFHDPNPTTDADLDVLMLTQGYRRFEWKKVLADNFAPIVYQPEKTLQISGHIKTFSGKPVAGGKITLMSTAGGTFIIDTVADDKGNFAFKNLVFRDSIKFVVQARTVKDRKNVEIELDNIAAQPIGKNKNAADVEVSISDGLSAYLKNSKSKYNEDIKYGLGNHTILLKEVVVRDRKDKNAELMKNSNNLNGGGNADQVLTYKDFENIGGTFATALQMKASFVLVRRGADGLNRAYSTRSPGQPMQLIVDGVYVEPDFLDNLNTNEIGSVEVLRTIGNTAIYGFRGSGGVLVITTRRGGEGGVYNRYAPGVVTYSPKGYYRAREFYSPQYDDPKTNIQMQDLRTTIYWNPGVVTDKDGNTTLSFFNADGKGTYRVLIEGIDIEGNLGRQVYTYKVE